MSFLSEFVLVTIVYCTIFLKSLSVAHNNDIGGILATKNELESSSDSQPDQTFYTVLAQLLQPYGNSSEVSDLRTSWLVWY